MKDRGRSRLPWFAIALVIVAAGAWLALRLAFPPFVPPPLPQPNGYDDLLRAAEMLAPRTGFYDEMPPDELTAIVEQNRPALALAREALDKECGVPFDWSRDPAAPGAHTTLLDQASAMRQLSRAFVADMRTKPAEGRNEESISSGLAAFQLGKRCYHGGLMVDYLVGLAVQGVAINEFRQLVAQDHTARAEILRRLVPLLETGESAEEVIQRELGYIKSASRGIIGWSVRLNLRRMLEPAVESARQAALLSTAQQRLFVIHLALHTYRDEHGSWPNTLAKVSPEILTIVPVDPYSKALFVYRLENGAYRLYSVGRNGADDGGDGDDTGLASDFIYDLTATEQ